MRMRESVAQFEQAFFEETELDRHRRERLQRTTAHRARQRSVARAQQRSSLRFGLLVLSLVITAIGVTVLMFETLYYVMG